MRFFDSFSLSLISVAFGALNLEGSGFCNVLWPERALNSPIFGVEIFLGFKAGFELVFANPLPDSIPSRMSPSPSSSSGRLKFIDPIFGAFSGF